MNNEVALLMNNESLWYFLTKMISNKFRQEHHNFSFFILHFSFEKYPFPDGNGYFL